MKTKLLRCRRREIARLLLASFVAGRSFAATFSEWQLRQSIEVPAAPGLVKVALPPATLDALRPALEDLRLADSTGNEVPFLVERPAPEPAPVHAARSFKPVLRGAATVLDIETGTDVPINAVTLETPEREFIKAVRIEGSQDGQRFTAIADGIPIFRQGAASELTVRFPSGIWTWLRLTLDDQRSPPAAFTGARLHAADAVVAPAEPAAVTVKSREEVDTDTRLVLDLGAANLTLARIEIETPEALFQREIEVRVPELVGEEIREAEMARGFIYALDAGNLTQVRKTTLPLDRQARSRELILVIRNFDSPPLAIPAVRASRRPVFLLFQARQAGPHVVYAGNSQCPAPRYDLSGLAAQLKNAQTATLAPSLMVPNAEYHPPETLPGLRETGASLDTRPWRFGKPVQSVRPGPQQVELDLDVLAHARPDLGDLRLVRDGKQVPYLIERTMLTRVLALVIAPADDPKQPRLSRWKLTLPLPNLPVTRLECRPRATLFQRSVRVWEEVPDGRGGRYRRELGNADWKRTTDSKNFLTVNLTGVPQTDTLFLEIDNGDNPPIELDNFRLTYSVTRLVFKSAQSPMLYYGNPLVPAPRYDLSIVAAKLLSADKAVAMLGAEEVLKKAAWTEGEPLTGVRGWLFWGILVLVVAGLIIVIVRLLPKPPGAGAGGTPPTW
jgi:Protein of unknown function (DUF3999)